MAKGAPNGEDLKLNFVAKVWDQKAEKYRPIYIAPDATDEVRGDVYLTDTPNEEDTAALGVTAMSPKGVYDVQQNLQNQINSIQGAADSYEELQGQVSTNTQNISELRESIQNQLPPVGTIYRTTDASIDPQDVWGGDWERDESYHEFQGFWLWTRTG